MNHLLRLPHGRPGALLLLVCAVVAGCGQPDSDSWNSRTDNLGGNVANAGPLPTAVTVRVISGGESAIPAASLRRMVVGPHVNQPRPFPGYRGFVGWASPLHLGDGAMAIGFSAGYWHASPPTPLRLAPELQKTWQELGMPMDIDAPRGGRTMITRSTDEGRTFSRPETLLDTPWDDRHPSLLKLPDGTILATLFTYPGTGDFGKNPELAPRTGIIRSTDGGHTWEQTPRRLPSPFLYDATDGPPIILSDGSILLLAYGSPAPGVPDQIGVFRSGDSGLTWALLSIVKTSHAMSESSIAQLPSGRLMLLARREGDMAFSDDFGRTWTQPMSIGMKMFEPGLVLLRDGTLLAFHGASPGGGVHVIFSTDGGTTWLAPSLTTGFVVDATVYGYAKGVELPDGSVYLVYIDSGGHSAHDAMNEAIWAVRLGMRPDHLGIELLPAAYLPKSPHPSKPRPGVTPPRHL